MKTIKGWIATTVILATLTMSATTANAGIIIAGVTSDTPDQPCTETTTSTKETYNGGIIIAGIYGTGIIIAGLAGIIIAGATSDEQTNCGIIIAG